MSMEDKTEKIWPKFPRVICCTNELHSHAIFNFTDSQQCTNEYKTEVRFSIIFFVEGSKFLMHSADRVCIMFVCTQ